MILPIAPFVRRREQSWTAIFFNAWTIVLTITSGPLVRRRTGNSQSFKRKISSESPINEPAAIIGEGITIELIHDLIHALLFQNRPSECQFGSNIDSSSVQGSIDYNLSYGRRTR